MIPTPVPLAPATDPRHRPALARSARPVVPGGVRRGLGLGEFAVDGGFWGGLQRTNAERTLRHCQDWMERLGWIANFDRVAAGASSGDRPGWDFSDSEVYKLLEALAWEYGRTGDAATDTVFRELAVRVVRAQDEDGYLNTRFGHAGQESRYTDLSRGHELYCTGHLLQAAVARMRTVGPDDELVAAARRAADHVCREFGVGADEGICGHPEIEMALVEFGRMLGEPRYVEQARVFVERRGHGTLTPIPLLGPAYFQDEVPVRDTTAWYGHAVRALYLAAGAVDVAVESDDAGLLAAVERQWGRTVERRTYITGGMGSRHQDEGFGDDFELPPDRAYCETCAGIASVMVSWRLYLATGDVRYADLMERTFYNVVATSPRSDGQAFFYANPLHQRVAGTAVAGDAENPRAEGGVRAPWFDVSCCPTNIARTLASWHTYAACVEGDEVGVLQYAPGLLGADLAGGARLELRITTNYPHDGRVHVAVVSAPERPVTLRLRVPGWADGATLTDAPGRPAPGLPGGSAGPVPVAPGWAVVERVFVPGDELVLELPVDPRLSWPDPRIDAVRGCVAVERGPLVLCLESTDLPDGLDLHDVVLDPAVLPRRDGDGALVVARHVARGATLGELPYGSRSQGPRDVDPIEVHLVPYHRWAEQGPATMRVFLPTT